MLTVKMEAETVKRVCIEFFIVTTLMIAGACRKSQLKPTNSSNSSTNAPAHRLSNEDSLKFYVWWINESDSANIPFYYWYDQVPKAFNPFNPVFANADSVLRGNRGISSYPKVDGKKVDRYSFLDRKGVVSGMLQGGMSGDFGFQVTAIYESRQSKKIGLYVIYVYKGSPAGKAGVQRGWKITSVNGQNTLNLTSSSNLGSISKAIYFNQTTSFTFQRPNGSITSGIDLNRTTYHINPVLFDTIYTVNNEKVGYLVYNSYISVKSGSNSAKAKQEIDKAFNYFKSAEVRDLIVDLRYNGGGAVNSAVYLDNLIAPASANGQVMFRSLYNKPLTDYLNSSTSLKSKFIDPVKYALAPDNLNLTRVFFIVSHNTYSASELTINNLKPYMHVYLVGDTTGGKPVGFFGLPVSFVTDTSGYTHVADMYSINFRSVNRNNEGKYYWGMVPDYLYSSFNISNWGDMANDARLYAALNFIKTGNYQRAGRLQRKTRPNPELRVMPGHRLNDPYQFNGMVNYNSLTVLSRYKSGHGVIK